MRKDRDRLTPRPRHGLWGWASDRLLFIFGVLGVAGVFTWLPELIDRSGAKGLGLVGLSASVGLVISTVTERNKRIPRGGGSDR
ncbi:MAG: hypothetical protein ACRDV9_04250 [Acidimicrobiia bacterium]